MAIGIKERLDNTEGQQRDAVENQLANMRVAIPGIIISFDPSRQTATVQPAINENVQIGSNNVETMTLPVLSDVPVFFPRSGGYSIMLPVTNGDECLLVFADMCIDGWWQSGGVQDQMETRRHDLSDAFAFVGFSSVPHVAGGGTGNSLKLQKEGGASIEISGDSIYLSAASINITGNTSLAGSMTISGENTISGIPFTRHVHGGIEPGGGSTSAPH